MTPRESAPQPQRRLDNSAVDIDHYLLQARYIRAEAGRIGLQEAVRYFGQLIRKLRTAIGRRQARHAPRFALSAITGDLTRAATHWRQHYVTLQRLATPGITTTRITKHKGTA